MSAAIRPALADDVAIIAAAVRPEDVAELWASARSTATECMDYGLRAGPDMAWTGTIDDEPVCMLGATPGSLLGGVGVPWMVGTTRLRKWRAQKALLRLSPPTVAIMRSRYDVLSNVVDERNQAAQRWLRWLGFAVARETIAVGPDRLPFRHFVMRSSHHV